MNIKDIETQSGMTRANIRFYESEGLLCPTNEEPAVFSLTFTISKT